jgi:hypothetical protein
MEAPPIVAQHAASRRPLDSRYGALSIFRGRSDFSGGML